MRWSHVFLPLYFLIISPCTDVLGAPLPALRGGGLGGGTSLIPTLSSPAKPPPVSEAPPPPPPPPPPPKPAKPTLTELPAPAPTATLPKPTPTEDPEPVPSAPAPKPTPDDPPAPVSSAPKQSASPSPSTPQAPKPTSQNDDPTPATSVAPTPTTAHPPLATPTKRGAPTTGNPSGGGSGGQGTPSGGPNPKRPKGNPGNGNGPAKPPKKRQPRKKNTGLNIKASGAVYTENAKKSPWAFVVDPKNPNKWIVQKLPAGTVTKEKAGDEADHIYEDQLLRKVLKANSTPNNRRQWEDLGPIHQKALQDIMNAPANMVFIPGPVNGSKGSRLRWASKPGYVSKPNSKRRQDTDSLISAGAPIAAATAQKIDDYLVKNGIFKTGIALPNLKEIYARQGWIPSNGVIPPLPTAVAPPQGKGSGAPGPATGTPNTPNTVTTKPVPITLPVGPKKP